MADIIRIARDRLIEDSRKAALLFLDLQHHLVGQQWQVRYYRDESRTEIDTIVAIGVRNGTGSECYKVISYGTATAIVSISETLPDVSQMVHGEIYIVLVEGIWNYVTVTNDTRRFDPITGGPYAYFNLEDGHVWYYTEHTPPGQPEYYPGILRRDDDFYTREELDEFIANTLDHLQTIDERLDAHDELLADHTRRLDEHDEWLHDLDIVCYPLTINASASEDSTVWASGTRHPVVFSFDAKKLNRDGETYTDVTSECKYYYKTDTSASWVEISNPFTVTVTGENEIKTFEFKGGNTELYGPLKKAEQVYEYTFGFRFLFGVVEPGSNININSLLTSRVMTREDFYPVTYDTDLSSIPVFALPTYWGNVIKITDINGTVDYTNSFGRVSGVFSRNVDGLEVPYIVYCWKSKPAVATKFIYRFYNEYGVDDPNYSPNDIEELRIIVERLDGGVETRGSVKYQINDAVKDLIGPVDDDPSRDTINASKNYTDESLTFAQYDN